VLRPGGRLGGEDWLRCEPPDSGAAPGAVDRIERLWAIPDLGSADHYLAIMREAGFERCVYQDLREVSALERGFAVDRAQQLSLDEQIRDCGEPLLALVLEGLKALGNAVAARCFTIGSFQAVRPFLTALPVHTS